MQIVGWIWHLYWQNESTGKKSIVTWRCDKPTKWPKI